MEPSQNAPLHIMDIQGIEPWTSRMRSVRATTVPNAQYIQDYSGCSVLSNQVMGVASLEMGGGQVCQDVRLRKADGIGIIL